MLGGNGHIKIFAGSASKQFAQKMCDYLGSPMGDCTTIHFSEGNTYMKLAVITHSKTNQSTKKAKKASSKNAIHSLDELTVGDYIVHNIHGIGVFEGIHALELNKVKKDYIKISYAKGDKKDEPRVSIRARVCADAIEMAGADRVVTMDLNA